MLLELLKEFGVTKYSLDGLTLEIGNAGSFKVINHKGETVDPENRLPPPAPVDPQLQAVFNRLPAHYRESFVLGS